MYKKINIILLVTFSLVLVGCSSLMHEPTPIPTKTLIPTATFPPTPTATEKIPTSTPGNCNPSEVRFFFTKVKEYEGMFMEIVKRAEKVAVSNLDPYIEQMEGVITSFLGEYYPRCTISVYSNFCHFMNTYVMAFDALRQGWGYVLYRDLKESTNLFREMAYEEMDRILLCMPDCDTSPPSDFE